VHQLVVAFVNLTKAARYDYILARFQHPAPTTILSASLGMPALASVEPVMKCSRYSSDDMLDVELNPILAAENLKSMDF
jgi:hypothetical protein